MFRSTKTKKFIQDLKFVLLSAEAILNFMSDPTSVKIDEAVKTLKVLQVTLEEMKGQAPAPIRIVITHFLEVFAKNIILLEEGKPISPMKNEFASMHNLTDHVSKTGDVTSLATVSVPQGCPVCPSTKKS